ncbi:MAG: hypothetical protein R3F55_04430 [Alphaproteobacteria bacterium]
MNLGDRDLAAPPPAHPAAARRHTATAIAGRIARALGVRATMLPATDSDIQTLIETPGGTLNFQEFFVRDRAGRQSAACASTARRRRSRRRWWPH